MLSDFHPRVQYGKWEWVTLKWRNLANITLSRWLRSTSIVINHVDRIFSWYNAFVTLLPTSPKPSLIMRIILENSNGRSSYKILNINSPNSQNHEKKTRKIYIKYYRLKQPKETWKLSIKWMLEWGSWNRKRTLG